MAPLLPRVMAELVSPLELLEPLLDVGVDVVGDVLAWYGLGLG